MRLDRVLLAFSVLAFVVTSRAEFMAGYKAAAGFAIETLNAAPPIIAAGARVG